ncbi:MAG: aminomethyl-transferring glycine dehydrogenase subunit GcvPA [Candidatus Aminicenantes bacterium]|nr:aminomethyl-transferring glycine dehydrogenase subunit GcvPA [Candidatus Aminicenantes bacterium]
MSYTSLSKKDLKDMMARIGVTSLEQLFKCIPDEIKCKKDLDIPPAKTEPELQRYFEKMSLRNTYSEYHSFLGAGAYSHYIPSVVDYLSSRGEFVSPYTPYQPEVSQGTLQVIFEFQTLICQLTGMDIANASLYDGASGVAEAVMMANRINRKNKALIAKTVHPEYRRVLRTYVKNLGIEVDEIGFAEDGRIDVDELEKKCDDKTTAVICQSPNFFGPVEDWRKISTIVHDRGAIMVAAVSEALSLGFLEPPGFLGADIVTGEGQSFGIPLSFGGPYLGFMACRKEFVRQFPGRIAGETTDIDGRRGFVLTLSTREQHIRRERATSNICTNQALCALRATIYLAALGREGLRELAGQNAYKARYARDKILQIPGVDLKFKGEFFNEFTIQLSGELKDITKKLTREKVIAGYELENEYPELKNCLLVCVTEMHSKEDIERLKDVLKSAVL